jgi:hypothetical protein
MQLNSPSPDYVIKAENVEFNVKIYQFNNVIQCTKNHQIASVEGGSIHISRIKLGVKIQYLNEVNHDMLLMNYDQISSFNDKKRFINLNPNFCLNCCSLHLMPWSLL